jgi:hypothetical protein
MVAVLYLGTALWWLQTDWEPSMIIDLIRVVPAGTFDSALLAYSWNLFSQDGYPVLEECARAGISVHVAGVWAGLHHVNAGSVRSNVTREESAEKMDKWKALSEKHGW